MDSMPTETRVDPLRIGNPISRVDGSAKAVGEARYIADIGYPDALFGRFYRSGITRGTIESVTLPDLPAGYHVISKDDVPGHNRVPLITLDWPVFADREVRYLGQIIYLVVGPDPAVLEELLDAIDVRYAETPAAVTIDDALALHGGPIHGEDNLYSDLHLEHGDVDAAFARAAQVFEGTYQTGFQEQLYLEPQGLVAIPEDGGITIHGSLQCPYYVKHAVEHAMGAAVSKVRVIQATTGGGFGGKEDYPEIMGTPLAVAAFKTGRPVKAILDRSEDLAFTSKRHPSRTRIRTALDETNRIIGIEIDIQLDGGAYESYTTIVLMRAIFTSTGVYNMPAARVRGRGVATNTVPSGAFRGFGAPQAIFAIETHLDRLARSIGADPLEYKRRFFLKRGDKTVTQGTIRENVVLDRMTEKISELSDYPAKRKAYATADSGPVRRGIGISVFNHGCGFTGDGEQKIIKAEVGLRKTADDRVEILVANIDMGQGPHTTFRKLVSATLRIPVEQIVCRNPDTDRVPNSGPTVASRTMMVVGYLVQEAAKKLRTQWQSGRVIEIREHYRMPPGMSWDQATLTGDAYAVFGWGVNVIEVSVDTRTWETHVTGAWGVYDVGKAIDELVVHGQIQGGMSQALGYGCLEKLQVDRDGRFMQASMADYMIPTSVDFPRTVAATIDNPYPYGPFGAKGMGEIVHDGGHAALVSAIAQAIGRDVCRIPAGPETLWEIMRDEA